MSNKFKSDEIISNNGAEEVKVSSYSLKKMRNSIINSKDLKCEESIAFRHAAPLAGLSDHKVNARTQKCNSYLKSLYNVIYPGKINPRKK